MFRSIDRENTGFISIDQVNSYLNKVDSMHQRWADQQQAQEVDKKPAKPQNTLPGYMRSKQNQARIINPKKPQPNGSAMAIGAHLVEPQKAVNGHLAT